MIPRLLSALIAALPLLGHASTPSKPNMIAILTSDNRDQWQTVTFAAAADEDRSGDGTTFRVPHPLAWQILFPGQHEPIHGSGNRVSFDFAGPRRDH